MVWGAPTAPPPRASPPKKASGWAGRFLRVVRARDSTKCDEPLQNRLGPGGHAGVGRGAERSAASQADGGFFALGALKPARPPSIFHDWAQNGFPPVPPERPWEEIWKAAAPPTASEKPCNVPDRLAFESSPGPPPVLPPGLGPKTPDRCGRCREAFFPPPPPQSRSAVPMGDSRTPNGGRLRLKHKRFFFQPLGIARPSNLAEPAPLFLPQKAVTFGPCFVLLCPGPALPTTGGWWTPKGMFSVVCVRTIRCPSWKKSAPGYFVHKSQAGRARPGFFWVRSSPPVR